MRDLRRVEKDAVVSNIELLNFFPHFTKTKLTTQKIKGRIICRVERTVKYIKKGGVS